uniref:Uncharacterized protein n=2 Tax=Brassica oleracea TaxID=3712 RepID=A0A0D3CHS3_BRAOL
MHDHFIKYGDILKVFIIFDKFTHRSKGYGFPLGLLLGDLCGRIAPPIPADNREALYRFKRFHTDRGGEFASAKFNLDLKDSTPIIDGRRANCNLASPSGSLRRSPTMASPRKVHLKSNDVLTCEGSKNVSRPRQDMWGKIKLNGTRPLTLPRPPNMTFNQKVGYIRGTYMNGYYAQPQPQPLYYNHHHLYGGGRDMVGASPMMPLYTFYPYHQSQAIGFTQPSFTKPISTHPIS